MDFSLYGEVLKRNLWDFCSVERREWSAENGILAKCLCKFKVYFKFLWIFCFMKHGKWIVKTEFAWIFCFLLTHSAQNDKVTCKIPCHTEALAEVSIKSKRALNSLDISPTAQYDKCLIFGCGCALQPVGSPFYKRLKTTNKNKSAFKC